MTRDEFCRAYWSRCDIPFTEADVEANSVRTLDGVMSARPCRCLDEGCAGWQMEQHGWRLVYGPGATDKRGLI